MNGKREKLFLYLDHEQYSEVKDLLLMPFTDAFANTHQSLDWHGEDDVLTHTNMVVDELLKLDDFRKLKKEERNALFCAAVLHDIGKPECTIPMNGSWTSPYHAQKGAMLAREYLWREFGFEGKKELIQFRENICLLVRYHDFPFHIMAYEDIYRHLMKIASNSNLVPGFNMFQLYLLAKADAQGRICIDKKDNMCLPELFAEMCYGKNMLFNSYQFPTEHTAFSFMNGKQISYDIPFYDDTWGEIILMSALPGTGKDTYIKENLKGLPMISLDDIRKELNCRPTDNQGQVIAAATEKAKAMLREHQPFVWNATCTTNAIRKRQIELFTNYGASARIIYLETEWETCLARNAGRKDYVPVSVIEKLRKNLVIPERFEATKVEWISV